MKKIILYISLLFSVIAFAQNEQLAQNYFDKGEFEKALTQYEELFRAQPNNSTYFQKIILSCQQLQHYDKAEKLIQERYEKYKLPNLLVELGYNFQLRNNPSKAQQYYDKAIEGIRENPSAVYGVANAFETKVLLENALKSYNLGTTLNPKMNFDYQKALLYGQLGDTGKMIDMFLDYAYSNPGNSGIVQNQLARFIGDDVDGVFSASLRKALLLKVQKDQDIFWNEYLSWFFVQQKDYGKAFIQEKAIYKRNPENFYNIVNLGELAKEEEETETAKEILTFVLENTQDTDLQIRAHQFLMKMKIDKATAKDNPAIQAEMELLLKKYGISPYSIALQELYAHFLTFNLNKPEEGKNVLKKALELQLNKYQSAEIKMELADILLYEQKYNQALIYYSQIENDLKNDAVGHEASLKVAKTSYFKGDFDWALKQLKELKSSSSQLIANDALELYLLINDNTKADSTQTALKKFAKADYLLYQNKQKEALVQFQSILTEDKGNAIEDAVLLKMGGIYEKLGDYTSALNQYQSIMSNHAEGIYIDEALFFAAEIYNKQLKDPEKAKPLYEKILFNHPDSIYFIESRTKFRQLRGDTNL
ncbi:tetratricopeptide repeat protein [Flavobacterium kingsejongi]|uniref:Tetratricopeptide repeat-like domain-containing protein n=1 Tax=Flavobacterium kingsejongi TaxID=1678728 RepID=A0A2S1LM21_9FLAO|nr:tetratricopeptide repeat protein [Flavobacterium kingsejongi]AWG24774.1 hypothetical protein FK004_05800 [Flavobacterium kingsejongi]